MHERCSACGERFEREPGQSFGAVYINFGLTLALTLTGYVLLQAFTSIPMTQRVAIWTATAAAGPLAFHRLSRGLWISVVFMGEGLYISWPSRSRSLRRGSSRAKLPTHP